MENFGMVIHLQDHKINDVLMPAWEIATSFSTVSKLLLHFPPPRKVLIQQNTIVISAFSHARAKLTLHRHEIQELFLSAVHR